MLLELEILRFIKKDCSIITESRRITKEYLNYEQIVQLLQEKEKKIKELTLKGLNDQRKIKYFSQCLQIHERILLCLKTNDIPRLHQIFEVCFNNNRSIGFLLGRLNDAIDKHYSPYYSKDDKDLALLVLKFGGPSLLEILHSAKGFLGISTSYRLVNSNKLPLL